MLVTQEVYDALVASVERWKRIMLDPKGALAWSGDCPLCAAAYGCTECPIAEDMQNDGCSGTPFAAAFSAKTHATCGAELDYLVGLLARCEVEDGLRSRDVKPGQFYKLKGDEARELFFMQISPVGADMRSWREHHGDMLPSVRMCGNSPGEISVSQPDSEVVLVNRDGSPLGQEEETTFGELAIGDTFRYQFGKGAAVRKAVGKWSGMRRKLEGLSAVCLEADDVFRGGEQHSVELECPVRKEVWRG